MRRSASSDRMSFGPLRVKNDVNVRTTSSRRSRSSVSGSDQYPIGRKSIASSSRPSMDGNSRKSFIPKFGQGNKTSRLSRGSGIGVRGNNGVPKDPRPVSDKGFQHRCIKNILQFLTGNHYRHNITLKILQSPTSKDFFKIFEFLYSFLEPNFRLSTKPEDEVPKILKLIGYPFMISRSSMFSIGSPHNWPNLLVALVYILELIQHSANMYDYVDVQMFPHDDDAFDTVSERQIQHDYVMCVYKAYMDGKDEYEEEDDQLKILLKQKFLGAGGGMDELIKDNNSLEEQLDFLENNPDQLKSGRQKVELMLHDQERFRSYIQELDVHRQEKEKALAEMEEELSHINIELEAESAKIMKMQLIYEKQEFSQEDVELIKMRRRELLNQKGEVDQMCKSVEEDIWKEEISVSKEMEQISEKCMAYNKLAHALKLIPVTAENSSGIDYEMKKPAFDGDVSDFTNKIKPALQTVKFQCAESVNKKESEKITHLENLEQASDRLVDIQNEVTLLESKHKRTEDEVETKKRLYQNEYQQAKEAEEDLQSELSQLKNLISKKMSDQQLTKEKDRVTFLADKERETNRKLLEENKKFLMEALQLLMEHFEMIKQSMEKATKHSEEERQKVQEEARQHGLL